MLFRFMMAGLLKAFVLYGCYRIAKHFFTGRAESAVMAYLLSMVMQNGLLLLLSPFRLVTSWGVAIGYVLLGVILLIGELLYSKKHGAAPTLPKPARLRGIEIAALALTALLFVGLTARPFFYFDTTDDALIQGMTKLAFIQQHRSLFVHYESLTINAFSNEWLGEMNGLYYMLLVGKEQAAGFGNVEATAFIALAALYCVQAYGYRGKHRYAIAFSVLTMPVILGLAMTIKTDLLSVILLPLSVAFLIRYYKEEKPSLLFASILCIGATAASKISVLPGAGLLLIALVIFYFFKAKKKPIFPVVSAALMAVILCNRYLLNLVQYGNPFQRALNEKMSLSLSNLKNSLVGCLGEFWETGELLRTLKPWASSNWVLTKGLGYLGIFCLLLFLAALVLWLCKIKKIKPDPVQAFCIALPVFLGFLFFCTSSIWYNWSYRYVAPYVTVVYFAAFVPLGRLEASAPAQKKSWRAVGVGIACCMLLLGCANSLSLFRTGQAFPYLPADARDMSLTQKKISYASCPKYADLSEHEAVMNILENGGSCLIFDTFSYPFYHFFGDGHCVEVDLALDEDALIEQAFEKNYDMYVIATTLEDTVNYPKAKAFFESHAYRCFETTSGLIFIK